MKNKIFKNLSMLNLKQPKSELMAKILKLFQKYIIASLMFKKTHLYTLNWNISIIWTETQ